MKSKLFRILGVVAVVAMIAASLVAPVSATVSSVTATTTTAGGIISTTGNYTIYATLASQLSGTTSGTITLPYVADSVKFMNTTNGDQVNISVSSGTVAANLSMAGSTGTYTAVTTTSGVISFTGAGQTENLIASVAGTVISYTKTFGNATGPTPVTEKSTVPTCSTGPGAFTLPDVGDSVVFTANAGSDVVTLSVTTGLNVVFSPVGTAGYAAGVITFSAAAQTATVTSTVAQVSGTWARTAGTLETGAAGADVSNPISFTGGTLSADTITVTFPSTFTVAAGAPTATISASTGWFTVAGTTVPVFGNAVLTSTSWVGSATLYTETFTLAQGDYIGANAQILINISAGVTNPGTAGNYTLTVQTSKETTPVTSSAFAISNPTPTPVAGIASVYNTAATPVLINNYISLNSALIGAAAVSGGATIKLTAGTYTDAVGAYAGNITIMGTDASAANVIIQSTGAWSLTGKNVTVNMLTIDASKGGTLTMVSTAGGAMAVTNSYLKGGVLTMNNTGTGATSTIYGDTFTVKTGAVGLTATAATTVTGSTFNVTGSGTGISAPADITVSGATFAGSSNTTDLYLGYGINLTSAGTTSAIGTSIFTGLTNALTVNGTGKVSFTGNTVTNCGEASPPATTAVAAIVVTATAGINISNNTITNGTSNIISVANTYAPFVNVSQNTFTGNAKAASSADWTATTGILNMARNWWGAAANVPANITLVATTTAGIQYTPALGGAPSAGSLTTAATLTAATTAFVNITASTGFVLLGASALSANPVAVAIPSADTAVKYFDVYGTSPGAGAGATVDFYGTTASPIVNSSTVQSAVLFYNAANGTWVNAGGVANVFANYFEIYVGATAGSVITAAQFAGTPFVLVTIPVTLGSTGTITYPTNGATGVPVNPANLTFTWPVVAGTGVTYQFALAQASANTTANEFAILDYSDNTITNAEPLQETLQYNTVYWWEVRAVTLNSSGAVSSTGPWTVSMFTTAAAPVTTTGTAATNTTVVTSVVITQPVTTVVSTQTSVVITQTSGSSTPAIPSYLLWAVIAVGAVLIIAVIVLIVRTRRIP